MNRRHPEIERTHIRLSRRALSACLVAVVATACSKEEEPEQLPSLQALAKAEKEIDQLMKLDDIELDLDVEANPPKAEFGPVTLRSEGDRCNAFAKVTSHYSGMMLRYQFVFLDPEGAPLHSYSEAIYNPRPGMSRTATAQWSKGSCAQVSKVELELLSDH